MLDKRYDFKKIEEGKVANRREKGYFLVGDKSKKPFSIIIPPPNVTGILHIGHATDNTFQDIICRYKKAKGFDVLYLPGVDHAGIATQAKVDAKLKAEGIDRFQIGREKYLEEAFKWKNEKSGIIHAQWEKLGLMLDYTRERFTLDEGFQDAVFLVFKRLYDEGLIYRGERIVNYDPEMKTALSNIEIVYKEDKGHFYYFKYRFVDDKNNYLSIATTRPETMFGDTCIVVNPNDERYKDVIGKKVINPANNEEIPIIADEYVDINFGTGAMKCTPAHDPNDFIIGKKYNLAHPVIMNTDGTMTAECGKYSGLDRFECREKLLKDIESHDDLIKIEEITHQVGHSERSDAVVEPILSKQWFVKMKPLAERVLENQKTEHKVKFYPERFENVLTRWLSDIDDWCISRQLWWGHRIPVWYKKGSEELVVSKTCPDNTDEWYQDEDVLDTWFSSALWPFATLGWPKETPDFKRYFPTSCLVTGYDIIFFWVSRMIFQSLHFTNQIPFNDVVIHGLVRDPKGKKMSKSAGNGVDPIAIIDQYGCDSLRYYLATTAAPGLDIKYNEEKIASSNAYLNKIWNSARYVLMNIPNDFDANTKIDFNDLNELDKFIFVRLNETIAKVTSAMDKYEFGIACSNLYSFVYDDFCDFYLEMSKVSLSNEAYNKNSTYYTLITILKNILLMIYPFAPFISEEIYLSLPNHKDSIMLESYPEVDKSVSFDISNILFVKETIEKIRAYKVNNELKPNEKIKLFIKTSKNIDSLIPYIQRFTFASSITLTSEEVSGSSIIIDGGILYIQDDVSKEEKLATLNKQFESVLKDIDRSEHLLNNPNFLNKANPNKVKEEQEKYRKYLEQRKLIEEKIKNI